MGISDTISGLMGKNPQMSGLVSGIQGFINKSGGFEGLKDKFEKEGVGSIVHSWISTGPNLPISQEQIQKVMGSGFVNDMAAKMGVDPTTATQKLTEILPKLIDHLTPNGQLPATVDSKSIMSAAAKVITPNSTSQNLGA